MGFIILNLGWTKRKTDGRTDKHTDRQTYSHYNIDRYPYLLKVV